LFNYATWAFASTLSLNRKYSVRAASRSQARRAQHRQARALTLPQLRRPPSFSLVPLRTPLCASPPARGGWPRCCVSGPRRRAEWGLPQMVFLIAEYSNKRLVANRALAAGTSMPGHRLSPFGWCSSPVLASFSAASSGGQPPFLLRAMADTPQPSAGNCRCASSPFRLPCGARFFPLPTAPPKKQTHPLGGFSSRRLLRKSLTPFPVGSPASPRFPLGLRPHPFSPKLSRFRACSFVAAETAPAPCFSQSLLWGGSLQSRARQKPEPGIPAKGFLRAQLFRSHEQRFLAGESAAIPSVIFSVFCLPTSVL
jgi:hypothetical protein